MYWYIKLERNSVRNVIEEIAALNYVKTVDDLVKNINGCTINMWSFTKKCENIRDFIYTIVIIKVLKD